MERRELIVPHMHPESTEPQYLIATELAEFELQSPPDRTPYSKALARIGIEQFEEWNRIPTPVTDEGLIDVEKLVEIIKTIVGDDYEWEAPFFDVHHLYWPAAEYSGPKDESAMLESMEYTDEEREQLEMREAFRELPINKIGVPRVFHDVVHAMFIPVPLPSPDIMKREVLKHDSKRSRRSAYLHKVATDAISLYERRTRLQKKVDSAGNQMWVDTQTRRTHHNIDTPELLEERRQGFIRQILWHHENGLIDLAKLAPLTVVDREVVEAKLKEIAHQLMADGTVVVNHQKVRKVEIAVKSIPRSDYDKPKRSLDAA